VFTESPKDEGAAGEPPSDDGTAERKMSPYVCGKFAGGTIGKSVALLKLLQTKHGAPLATPPTRRVTVGRPINM
jgi:hypothetical protein